MYIDDRLLYKYINLTTTKTTKATRLTVGSTT